MNTNTPSFFTLSTDGTRTAYTWNGTSYVPLIVGTPDGEEEPRFKTNKEYKEWLNKQNDPIDGTKERPSGV